ncbi:MAG TPA: oligopeptide transporter, OPT family [Planctomycetaceae bacterium]|nr:oligopeptide transporter, OPT family [Planctomycetaceae bacterium]
MILIGYWEAFDYWSVTIVAFTGGLLGILFMIPMRKVFVVDNDELTYPEGIACAAVLRAGNEQQEDSSDGVSLIAGGVLGAAFALAAKFLGIISGALEGAAVASSRLFYIGGDLSPMLVAVGFIVRLNVAILIFIGGAIAWLVGIPLYGGAGEVEKDFVDAAYGIWSTQIRYVGVGAMVVGGFASLISVRHGLLAAITHLRDNLTGAPASNKQSERDIPTTAILALLAVCVGLLAFVNYQFTQSGPMTALTTVVMLVLGFFFTAVASYIVGLVGNSNSPVSGMTITAVLVAGGILYVCNYSGMDGMVATLGVAAIVCCIACTSGDVCNDLKTGSLVGATPFRQQIMQVAGVFVAALVMAPVLTLLHENTEGGIGGKDLPAPQAGLFASLAESFSGEGELPWNMVGWGVLVGLVILIIDEFLKRSKIGFRAYLMPIAVGMYLPFGLALPILIGGLIAHFYSRGHAPEKHDGVLHRGVLFSSGVIAGEALTSVGLACLAAIGIKSLSALTGLKTIEPVVTGLSIAAAIFIVVVFVIFTRPSRAATAERITDGEQAG